MDMDGSNIQVIISKGQYGWSAQGVAKWSPDGENILMAAMCKDDSLGYTKEKWRLIVTDKEGKNPVIISTKDKTYADPNWSPDGTKICYISYPGDNDDNNNNRLELHIGDFNSTTQKIDNEKRLTTNDQWEFDPMFTHDRTKIVFSQGKTLELPFNVDIYHVNIDGSGNTKLLDDKFCNGVPYISPDDKFIFFHTTGIGINAYNIEYIPITGGEKKLVRIADNNKKIHYGHPSVTN